MRLVLVRNWWLIVIRGALGILFGLVTFAWPNITVGALALLFGAYALIEGIVSIVGAVRAAEAHDRWGALIVEGLVGIAAAVITIAWPAITALALAAGGECLVGPIQPDPAFPMDGGRVLRACSHQGWNMSKPLRSARELDKGWRLCSA
jgi:hypothetical protein